MSKTIGRTHSDGVYVGRKACGCAVAVVTDTSDKLTAKSVAEFIKEGLKVTWVSWQDYQNTVVNEETFMGCPHGDNDGKQLGLFEQNGDAKL